MNHPKLDIKIKLSSEAVGIPEYKTFFSSGVDLTSIKDTMVYPKQSKMIGTGISVDIPVGFEAQVRSRSGLAAKSTVFVLNTPGTIDCDYRGEIKVILYNAGSEDFYVKRGDRIAQLIFAPVVQAKFELVEELSETMRGEGGFGSTGV